MPDPIRYDDAVRQAKELQKQPDVSRDTMLDRAFAFQGGGWVVVLSLAAGLVVTFILGGMEKQGKAHVGLWVLAPLGAGGVLALVAYFARASQYKKAQYRWLKELPFPIDRSAYLDVLGAPQPHPAIVRVRVRFVSEVPRANQPGIRDVVAGELGDARVEWDASELMIESPKLVTNAAVDRNVVGTDDDWTMEIVPDNRSIHVWMRGCFDDAVSPLHGGAPIAGVDLSVSAASAQPTK